LAVGFSDVQIVVFVDDSLTRRASYDSVRVQAIDRDPHGKLSAITYVLPDS
jgi:hypothetical protein